MGPLEPAQEQPSSIVSDSITRDRDPSETLAVALEPTLADASSQIPDIPSDVEKEDLGAVASTSMIGGAALGATAALGALSLSDPSTEDTDDKIEEVTASSDRASIPHAEPIAASLAHSKIYTLPGKGLKLNSRDDFAPYAKDIEAIEDLEEIHVGGHTLGVGACQALADALREKKSLKVSAL